ncbi:hypothetical protein CDAR_551551 [Caerostris darwini]|uniref:Secreted protein n=1 Tax=Caerostris darwini TaxID=1538125 RepID=A0AAV4V6P5_9ARAC|nr:hypothetical protein CDAR_551551 [Caerostris darwini]
MWAMGVTMMQVRAGKSQFLLSAVLHAFQMYRPPRENELKHSSLNRRGCSQIAPGMVPVTRGVKMPPSKRKMITEKTFYLWQRFFAFSEMGVLWVFVK